MWNITISSPVFTLTTLLSASILSACSGGSSSEPPIVSKDKCAIFGVEAKCDIATGRLFQLISPVAASAEPRPVLLAFHGSPPSYGTPEKLNQFLALQQFADQYGYLIALPQGGDDWAWSSELQPGATKSFDTQYAQDIVDRLVSAHNADASKVATIGFSAGAMMSYQLICQIPEQVKAAFTISGQAVGELAACQPALPVALHHLHGTGDTEMPINGRVTISGKKINSLTDTLARFRQINGCASTYEEIEPKPLQTAGNLATRFEYQGCLKVTGYTLVETTEHQPDYIKTELHTLMHTLFDSAF